MRSETVQPIRKKAWLFAHKLLTLGQALDPSCGYDLLHIPTAEITKAMGCQGRAKLEDVQAFIFHVLDFLREFDMVTACGCGYLSLRVAPKSIWEDVTQRSADFREFTVSDVDARLDEILAQTPRTPPPASLDHHNQCETR